MSERGIGDNKGADYGQQVTDRLAEEYASLVLAVKDFTLETQRLPAEVIDEETSALVSAAVKRGRDLAARLEGIRIMEGEPFLRGKNANDQFFFGNIEKLFKRKKTDKDGAGDVLELRVHLYNMRRRQEEEQRRLEAERIAREAALKAAREREEAERKQREAEATARRKRGEETKAAAEADAREAAAEAARKRAEEDAARDAARQATMDATAKSADLVRERHDGGVLNTMRDVPFVDVTDVDMLDKDILWFYIKEDHKIAALKLWAKQTSYKKQMAGAVIGYRPDTVIR